MGIARESSSLSFGTILHSMTRDPAVALVGLLSPWLRTMGTIPIMPPLADAGWSSLVARRAHNPKVVGSNPAPATNFGWSRKRDHPDQVECVAPCSITVNRPQSAGSSVAVGIVRRQTYLIT